LCEWKILDAPTRVRVNEPFELKVTFRNECVLQVGWRTEGRVIFSGWLFKGQTGTVTVTVPVAGVWNFELFDAVPQPEVKLGTVSVTAVSDEQPEATAPCEVSGADTPYLWGDRDIEVEAVCKDADGLVAYVVDSEGNALYKAYKEARKLEFNINYLLQKYGLVEIRAWHTCNNATCGKLNILRVENAAPPSTTTTSVAPTTTSTSSSTTSSTSVAPTTTSTSSSTTTSTTSVAPTTTTTTVAAVTVPSDEFLPTAAQSSPGMNPSTEVPVGLFGRSEEGATPVEDEVAKIALDEPPMILICDEACVEEVAEQTGADPQDYGAIEVRVGEGEWRPAFGGVLQLVEGRNKVEFRGRPAVGAPVVLSAELFTKGTPIVESVAVSSDGQVTNAVGEVVATVPVYEVVESGFSLAWWMWLLAGLAALVLLFLLSLFWRKRISALSNNYSTGDRSEQK
jgi:hypothetical protein